MTSLGLGLHVFYSNQVERLAAQLALELALYRGAEGIWKPALIVVPNPNVRDYLKSRFAEAFGAVANLDFCFMEGFWTRHANRNLLDRGVLLGSLLSALQDPALRSSPELAVLARYLDGAPEDLKTVQLSERLAQHFERVLLNRPDWIRAWEQNQPARAAAPASLEAWQRALWRRLRGAWKTLADPPITLAEWLQDPAFRSVRFPEAVFFFGMSHMAPLYHQALAQVGTRASVRLYLVNPCLEPWDLAHHHPSDPLTPAVEFPEGEDPFALERDRSELILQRWARPSREQLRLLSSVTQGECLGKFRTPLEPTLLAYLQRRILAPERPLPAPLPEKSKNPSLRLIPCPTQRREAETVASLIWELVHEAPGSLHFGDIGVLVPAGEEDAYLDHLGAAFRSAHAIPWAQALGASRNLQDLVEAAVILLDLAGGALTRAEVLRAVAHPFLQEQLGGAPDLWALLCDQAGIVARADAQETAETYLEGGRWTWAEGLTRLALGRFMKAGTLVETLGSAGRPVSGGTEAPAMLATLGPLVADLRQLSRDRCELANWQDKVTRLFTTYLGPATTEATEAATRAFADLLRALQRLGAVQLQGLPPPVLDFQAARLLVKGALEHLLKESALPPGRGVQVSCYTPLRAVPFKALFLMGLGEGLFPGTERPDPLDLVASSPRRAGDVSRPEQERQLFLESILCTRQTLTLTYPSRAAITGEALPPSPLLRDLEETLGDDLWPRVLVPEQPLHRHDFSHFPELSANPQLPCHLPAARREAEACWLGLHLRNTLGGFDLPRQIKDWGGPATLQAALDAQVNACGPLSDQPLRLPSRVRITLKDLRRWLECPVQGGVALRLNVQEEKGEDVAELEQEPLDTNTLESWGLLRKSLWTALAQNIAVATCYEQLREVAEAAAKAPLGALSQGERARHLNRLERWAHLLGPSHDLALHRFGAGMPYETRGLPMVEHPALTLTLTHPEGALDLRLEGLTEPMRGDAFLLLSTAEYTEGAPADRDKRGTLRAWVGHLALCAAGAARERMVLVHCTPTKKPDAVWSLVLPAVTPEQALGQLATWGREILIGADQKLLPLEALLAGKAIPNLQDWIQDQQDKEDFKGLTSFRGPVPRVKDLPAGDLEQGRARLQGFLNLQDRWVQA